jgi:putative transcriptional regulator
MSESGRSILKGAGQALAYAKGNRAVGRATRVRVPDAVDVKRIRGALQLTQVEFAARFGFSVAAVRDWEQRRRRPDASARVLLTVIANDPGAVERALGARKRA